jgi:hypothetical protein
LKCKLNWAVLALALCSWASPLRAQASKVEADIVKKLDRLEDAASKPDTLSMKKNKKRGKRQA